MMVKKKVFSQNIEGQAELVGDLLPVSLLCGFLGAGKTTLLKHVLETKHAEEGFKCAVIVNDMAALNIDKSLIDQSALVQSDEVIAMQNGCFCCTLRSDLVDQIIELAQKKLFSYILIEASGVSEPSQIAPMFEPCDDEHDHEEEHKEGPQLSELARLDTCVTVVDAAEFHNNLQSMEMYESNDTEGTITELMMEQIEFSNVVVLNKKDLVTDEQLKNIEERISLLNPKAKIVQSCQSKINVMEILNTKLFSSEEMKKGGVMISAPKVDNNGSEDEIPSCCVKSVDDGKKKCCKSKNKNLIDSGLSTVLLGVVEGKGERSQDNLTRHQQRFGITSFVYRARRPFHPGRLFDEFLDPFFILRYQETDESQIEKLQKAAGQKQIERTKLMGELLRSKGFIWIASSNYVIGGLQQAGNILKIEAQGPWLGDHQEMWKGTPSEKHIYKDMVDDNGEEYPYMDRRQELVFIGHKLNHLEIQTVLDKCLLNDGEFQHGPGNWKETMADMDKIQLDLEDSDTEDVDNMENLADKKDEPNETPGKLEEKDGAKLFYQAVDVIFKNWPALQLAVANQSGGPQSKEKAEWMVGATVTWFHENEDLEDREVGEFLEDVVSTEFNLEIEDGSCLEIGQKICDFFQFCANNSESAIETKLSKLTDCDLVQFTVDEKNSLDGSNIIDEENSVEKKELKRTKNLKNDMNTAKRRKLGVSTKRPTRKKASSKKASSRKASIKKAS